MRKIIQGDRGKAQPYTPNMSDFLRIVFFCIGIVGYIWMYTLLSMDMASVRKPCPDHSPKEVPSWIMNITEGMDELSPSRSKFEALARLINGQASAGDMKVVRLSSKDGARSRFNKIVDRSQKEEQVPSNKTKSDNIDGKDNLEGSRLSAHMSQKERGNLKVNNTINHVMPDQLGNRNNKNRNEANEQGGLDSQAWWRKGQQGESPASTGFFQYLLTRPKQNYKNENKRIPKRLLPHGSAISTSTRKSTEGNLEVKRIWLDPIYTWNNIRDIRAWVIEEKNAEPPPDDMTVHNRHVYNDIVIDSFRYFGFYVKFSESAPREWDVCWGMKKSSSMESKVTESQSVHHLQKMVYGLPGMDSVIHKQSLYTSGTIRCMKKFFILPEQASAFVLYGKSIIATNPFWNLVGPPDSKTHNLTTYTRILSHSHSKSLIVREYLIDPLLISGKRVSVSVYLVATRANPVVVYLYSSEWQVNMCENDFVPRVQKSMEEKCLLPLHQLPHLKDDFLHDAKLTAKQYLLNHLEENNLDAKSLEERILNAATEIFTEKEREIQRISGGVPKESNTNNLKNYGLYRMDMELDLMGKPWVTELDKDPFRLFNFETQKGKDFVRDIVRESLVLAGITSMHIMLEKSLNDLVSDEQISTNNIICQSESCKKCLSWKCKFCKPCLTKGMANILKNSYLEQRRKVPWLRVMPLHFMNKKAALNWAPEKDQQFSKMSELSKALALWYSWKCSIDSAWCS